MPCCATLPPRERAPSDSKKSSPKGGARQSSGLVLVGQSARTFGARVSKVLAGPMYSDTSARPRCGVSPLLADEIDPSVSQRRHKHSNRRMHPRGGSFECPETQNPAARQGLGQLVHSGRKSYRRVMPLSRGCDGHVDLSVNAPSILNRINRRKDLKPASLASRVAPATRSCPALTLASIAAPRPVRVVLADPAGPFASGALVASHFLYRSV